MTSARMQHLAQAQARLRLRIEAQESDPSDLDYVSYLQQQLRDLTARLAAAAEHPDDLVAYFVSAYRHFSQSGLLTGRYGGDIVARVTEFTNPLYFTPLETSVLNALQAAYGDALCVETVEANIRTTVATTEIYRSYTAHVFHEDFYPKGKWYRKLTWDSALVPNSRLEDFCIHGGGIETNLIPQVRSFGVNNPAIDTILEDILGSTESSPDGVLSVPTWSATRLYEGRGYTKYPTLGRKIGFDAELLLTDGVVVDLKNLGRYRVWFDYTRYTNEDGWMNQPPSGERVLRLQRTEDSVTTRKLKQYESCYMRGKGCSQQASGIVPFKGRNPYCLMSFHVDGADYTFTVMVDVDGGNIVRAWVEGSCT
jgi:hypothetical protein